MSWIHWQETGKASSPWVSLRPVNVFRKPLMLYRDCVWGRCQMPHRFYPKSLLLGHVCHRCVLPWERQRQVRLATKPQELCLLLSQPFGDRVSKCWKVTPSRTFKVEDCSKKHFQKNPFTICYFFQRDIPPSQVNQHQMLSPPKPWGRDSTLTIS